MFIDAWLGSNVELDFKGESMEQFTQLINYCQQNKIPYKASMEYREDGMAYELTATTTNEAAYVLIRDYKNRGGN